MLGADQSLQNPRLQAQDISRQPSEGLTMPSERVVGAEHVRFDLSDIYSGIDDPLIEQDLQIFEVYCKKLSSEYRGKLDTKLGDAIDLIKLTHTYSSKLTIYLYLLVSCDQTSEAIIRKQSQLDERISTIVGDHKEFFKIEVGKLDNEVYERLIASDSRVAFHKPFLDSIRKDAQYNLSEEVERALTVRESIGPKQWTKFIHAQIAKTHFPLVIDGETKLLSIEETLNYISENSSQDIRAAANKSLNDVLGEKITPLSVHALNNIIGLKNIEDRERGYQHPMSKRNIENKVSDEVVSALHSAVKTKGAELAKRFYKLMAHHLGVETLNWSDRNAPLNQSNTIIPWTDAVDLVLSAYQSFSPTLAKIFQEMIDLKRVDAPHSAIKKNSAFSYSCVFPDGSVRSYNFLNYLGSDKDVQTVAHEGGHAVHEMLSGIAQGPLMQDPPIAYAETASIFAEMVTFEYLINRSGSPEEKLVLLMDKIKDAMNSIVRQTGFSCFEQRVHEERKKGELTTEQFNTFWMDSVREFYGEDGEVFNYKDMENLWSYINHFHNPFYVYGYAFGDLLTQSLYAVRDDFGDRFEPLYLDLLRAGNSKSAVELLAPFGLNPEDPQFWIGGMEVGIEKWIEEAEKLTYTGGILLREDRGN